MKLKINDSVFKIYSQVIEPNWRTIYKANDIKGATGTGFFIGKSGYAVTCSHVVHSGKYLLIEMPQISSKKYNAEVVITCPFFDIAIIKVDYNNQSFLRMGNAFKLKNGIKATAIGFPLGQANIKHTEGIISGTNYFSIQTDTPINPGNSGGPLIVDERVIGVNQSKVTQHDNIGYSTPINYISLLKHSLKHNPKLRIYRQGYFGITYQYVTPFHLKEILDYKKDQGVVIDNFYDHSPFLTCSGSRSRSSSRSQSNNIKKGDLLLSINGKKISTHGNISLPGSFFDKMELAIYLATLTKYTKIPYTYWNGSKELHSSITVGDYIPPVMMHYPEFERIDYEIVIGMVFMDLSAEHIMMAEDCDENSPKWPLHITRYGVYPDRVKSRVILTYIYPSTYIAGLEYITSGLLVDEVNGKKITNLKSFQNALLKPKLKNGKKYIEIIIDDKIFVMPVTKINNLNKEYSENLDYPETPNMKRLASIK